MLFGLIAAAGAAIACGQAATQADLNRCAAGDYRKADDALNAQWRRTLTMAGQDAGAWRAAQRAWIGFRDAECAAESAGSVGGSMHGMDIAACKARLTRERTRQLAVGMRAR